MLIDRKTLKERLQRIVFAEHEFLVLKGDLSADYGELDVSQEKKFVEKIFSVREVFKEQGRGPIRRFYYTTLFGINSRRREEGLEEVKNNFDGWLAELKDSIIQKANSRGWISFYTNEYEAMESLLSDEDTARTKDDFIDQILLKIPEAAVACGYNSDRIDLAIILTDNKNVMKEFVRSSRKYSAAGLSSSHVCFNVITIASDYASERLESTVNHEFIHWFDNIKGEINSRIPIEDLNYDKKRIDDWKNENSSGIFNSLPQSYKDFIKLRLNIRDDAVAEAFMSHVADRIKFAFELNDRAYDGLRDLYTAPENMAHFATLVRDFSQEKDLFEPNAPIYSVTALIAPRMTEFYRDVYMQELRKEIEKIYGTFDKNVDKRDELSWVRVLQSAKTQPIQII